MKPSFSDLLPHDYQEKIRDAAIAKDPEGTIQRRRELFDEARFELYKRAQEFGEAITRHIESGGSTDPEVLEKSLKLNRLSPFQERVFSEMIRTAGECAESVT
ncbi:hypothetical protein HY419_02090, partial [candidate division WWE3 bacterium]|nr:hypothetical protein [candidate division WWE3 bacterium]